MWVIFEMTYCLEVLIFMKDCLENVMGSFEKKYLEYIEKEQDRIVQQNADITNRASVISTLVVAFLTVWHDTLSSEVLRFVWILLLIMFAFFFYVYSTRILFYGIDYDELWNEIFAQKGEIIKRDFHDDNMEYFFSTMLLTMYKKNECILKRKKWIGNIHLIVGIVIILICCG